MVISENGQSINHLLRKSLCDIPQLPLLIPQKILKSEDLIEKYDPTVNDEPIEFKTKRQFDPNEDILLLQLKNDGLTYTQMAPMFKERTANSLRLRYNSITGKKKRK